LTVILAICLLFVLVSKSDAARLKHSPRYLTAVALNRGLLGSPMENTGFALERAGWRWKVSPFFIAGIAATESSLGRASCSGEPYNAYGLGSCSGSWVPHFRSWAESYWFMARFLNSRWPRALFPWDFNGYAACSACWGNSTARHMAELFGVGPETRYGAVSAVA
jgi:hypothetical protein